jgi:hypothetical protein
LILLLPGLPGTARAQASDEDKVSFVWAFEALVAEGKVTKQVPIKEDMKLKTGDQLKMFVELRKLCFVYVIHHGCSSGSTLKKKKGQTSDPCGSHHHTMGGLAYAKTPGLGPTVPQSGLFPLSADAPRQH